MSPAADAADAFEPGILFTIRTRLLMSTPPIPSIPVLCEGNICRARMALLADPILVTDVHQQAFEAIRQSAAARVPHLRSQQRPA